MSLRPIEWKVYRAMLRLLPRDMRHRFGPDMAELFAVRLDRARGSR